MFSSFKDAFIRKPQFTVKIPDAVLETIGKELPEGFRYVEDHDGFCHLDCEGVLDIRPTSVRLPEEARPLFDALESYTMKDVMAYSYNAQQNIEFLPDEDECYTVNGKKIKLSDFVVAPLKNMRLEGGRMYMVAPPFPPPFPLEVAGNGYSMTLMVQRQPLNSLNQVKIASVDNSTLKLSYIFDETNRQASMRFNIQMCPNDSASEILASKEIFNAFLQGNGTFAGARIKPNDSDSNKLVSDEVIAFWHRVVEVEDVLEIKFDMSKEISIDDIRTIDAFHKCFVEKKAFKIYQNSCDLHGTGKLSKEGAADIGMVVGKGGLFEYEQERETELFGVTLKYFAVVGIVGGVISEVELPPDGELGEFSVKLVPPEGERMYTASLYCINKEDIDAIRTRDGHFEIFHAAEELEQY